MPPVLGSLETGPVGPVPPAPLPLTLDIGSVPPVPPVSETPLELAVGPSAVPPCESSGALPVELGVPVGPVVVPEPVPGAVALFVGLAVALVVALLVVDGIGISGAVELLDAVTPLCVSSVVSPLLQAKVARTASAVNVQTRAECAFLPRRYFEV